MALLDEGETDWKVLAIDVKDPLAAQLNGTEEPEWVEMLKKKFFFHCRH